MGKQNIVNTHSGILFSLEKLNSLQVGDYVTLTLNANGEITNVAAQYYTVSGTASVTAATINLNTISNPTVSIAGYNVIIGGETDLTYLFDLMQSLKQSGKFDDVVSIDCAKKFGVSYVRGDRFRVELGAVSDMETKLELVDLILARKVGDDATCAVVNVSDLKKPTFRAVGTPELLLG